MIPTLPTSTLSTILALTWLLATPAPAQDAADPDARFNESQADKINKFAQAAYDKGFYSQARLQWRQVIKLYNPDDPVAHKALCETKQGRIWVIDSRVPEYPSEDKGNERDGQALWKRYESLKQDLARAHKSQAQKWAKADRKDRAEYHWKMVLRWDKRDKDAEAALNFQDVGGLSGTELEQTLYDRSLQMEDAIKTQAKIQYPVEEVADSKHPILEAANMQYKTVKSEHFTLRGNNEVEVLKKALVFAEQALRVCQAVFPKGKGFNEDPKNWITDWAYFIEKDQFVQILRAHASRVPDLEWQAKETVSFAIDDLRFGASGSERVLFDAVVRNVAQAYSGFASTGMREGIGHTLVGQFFNNNHLFAVDRKKQEHTVTSEEDRAYTRPDFDLWKDLALEMAWKQTGQVQAAELPLCKAHDFSNPQRIKAWSFCDYMMRRDPTLIQAMDRLMTERNPIDVEAKFTAAKGISIQTLDKEWQDFWTGASPVLRHIRKKEPPLFGVSKDVGKWLDAINEERKKLMQAPVSWSSNYSIRCREHAEYLKANKSERGPGKEHQQDETKPGSTHLGSMFAQAALVDTKASAGKAKKIVESWRDIPGYRDLLMNQMVLSVGVYSTGSILVINAVSGLGKPKSGKVFFTAYPVDRQQGVPGSVSVKDLGPELEALLEKNGKGNLKQVGYPISLHFGMGINGKRSTYACSVTCKGKNIPTLIMTDGGNNRRTTAPGMVTAYPLEPLKGPVTAMWTWEEDRGQQSLTVNFTAK